MLIGLLVVFLIYTAAQSMGLLTVEWIFSQFFSVFIVILVVLFQSEIRKGLMSVAVNPLMNSENVHGAMIDGLVHSAAALRLRGWGGLIVIERETGLKHLYDSGVEMDLPLDADVVQTLFCPEAPLHDGALIVKMNSEGQGRIVAARVLLPLAQQQNEILGMYGTRHRAAVGVTEESDALVVVVSEERRDVHLVENGQMSESFVETGLKSALTARLVRKERLKRTLGKVA
ncbi:MAG: DNA integrity scanning protein DisA nucleotide-binding domain protein [Zetaproteobacteria bacterium]|nr:DNA integrity scanning protein DisA nucleotide-binding domain protein [Zetaproteobacteria bacterium]